MRTLAILLVTAYGVTLMDDLVHSSYAKYTR